MAKLREFHRRRDEPLSKVPITCRRVPLISKDTKVFTIGSCFALEIQNHLIKRGYRVLNEQLRDLESGDNQLIWYNTYTIAYEFDRVHGSFYQNDDDVWKTPRGEWQDPYRRCVFAKTRTELLTKIRTLDQRIRKYIKKADLIIITLGLAEVWFCPNGRAMCVTPGYPKGRGGGQGGVFRFVSYETSLENMDRVVRILAQENPGCQILITVSPVPLVKTFLPYDHLVANTEGKSIMRAVAGALARKYDNVHYFHSYEMATFSNVKYVYKPDGRHLKPEFVGEIVSQFERYFVK